MQNPLQRISSVDRARCVFVALLITLTSVVTFHRGDLNAGTIQAVFTADAAIEHETETVDNFDVSQSARVEYVHPTKVPVLPPEQVDTETLWLARALYSETKRPEEQELVAWAIRNRVETAYRGERSYRGAILDPYQFSAFNPNDRERTYFVGLTPHSRAEGWQQTISIAKMVKDAPGSLRPFSPTTRHYFSQRSMVGGGFPDWTRGARPVTPERDYDIASERFRFYAGIP